MTKVNISTPRTNARKSSSPGYRYTVKVINPGKKSSYDIHKLVNFSEKFASLDELKQHLTELLGTQIDDVGYISPGHGLKGRQNTCLIDEDVDHIYEEFKRKDILLWCYDVTKKNKVECTSDNSKTRKRSHVSEDDAGEKPKSNSKRDMCMNKIQEVEQIVDKEHGNALNLERYGPTCFIQGNILLTRL